MNTIPTPPNVPQNAELMLNPEDSIALSIACGLSRRVAATKAGVGLSTVQRRMADSNFRRRVKEIRAAMLDQSVGALVGASRTAVRTLKTLCRSGQNEFARLAAARAILELAGLTQRAIDAEQTLARVEAMEQILRRK